MKSFIFLAALGFGVSAVAEEALPLQAELNQKQAYQLYEYLNVPARPEPDGRRLVKRTDNVECAKTSFYPGDFEYSCSVSLAVDEAGKLVP
jgi:hypothetical protein